jgi:hypothetical protein
MKPVCLVVLAPLLCSAPAYAQQSDRPATGAPPGSLSDKLDKSDGVIKPADDVDPKMTRPTPETESATPVIPPPGSPGGRKDIEPK